MAFKGGGSAGRGGRGSGGQDGANGGRGRGGGPSKYQQQLKGGNHRGGRGGAQGQAQRSTYGSRQGGADTLARDDEIDAKFGFERLGEGPSRRGWLLNYLPITMADETGMEKSGLDLYFLDRDGGNFKASIFFDPYFYLVVSDFRRIAEISQHLNKRFEGVRVSTADKEDLEMRNHLSPGKHHRMIKLSFNTVKDLMDVKQQLRTVIQQNQKRIAQSDFYDEDGNADGGGAGTSVTSDPLAFLSDMREHDVPYTMRASIDLDLRVGAWFDVTPIQGSETCSVVWQKDVLELCQPRVLAWDIECEKSPLKFPNAEHDRIYMISYMVCGKGFLLTNREVVTEDVPDFEYTPEGFEPGMFTVFNLPNEEAMLRRFVSHVQELRPHVLVTYNGDFFDWPYVENRCGKYSGLDLFRELGVRSNKSLEAGGAAMSQEAEYTGRCVVHLDAFCWVKRDSYLPQGNQGLKAVTREKLGYNPVEIDPEDMLREAQERPRYMASYSVSDAVATYYLYTTYVHNFIFSLSTIIPMGPEDVLRKGSGTLCEALLMVEAFRGNIICPNKQNDPLESFHEGHLLESETYIGGHVECLEAGVFRSDLPCKFSLVPSALQGLINNIDRDLTFALETENGIQRSEVVNYDDVRQAIIEKLEMLRDCPVREEPPIIYHLDVGAMYPNIILTNRLQPSAIVSQNDCAACDYNRAENGCKRPMTWTWRGDYSPASQSEYQSVKRQLQYERVDDRPFTELSEKEQAKLVSGRLKKYAHRVYKKTKVTREQERVDTVCMRENAFYVNTVRAFRDRRYDYKLLTKQWANKKKDAEKRGDAVARKQADDKEVLMDSLQLAHKCILNSFYGYVMRKGARWRSMEMAGIVTHTGANLITQARELVEQVGRPLELDTDGIWCILPSSFPRDFSFTTKSGSKVGVGYPCAMLNADVHDRYTNHQYQNQVTSGQQIAGAAGKRYATHSECSIFFELDGPYHAMVLPASPEEGKLLKKKYVVFDFKGNIKELKGYEIKRRGELELVKSFQSEVFSQFLEGKSLEECYAAVGDIANQKLDILDSCGRFMDDDELMELISERKTISKTLDDYEGRKQTSLTTAARLADFLGPEMVRDKGLNCNLIISRFPSGAPVTERAIPVVIFSEKDPQIKRHFLRKWLKEPTLDCDDFRELVDWSYYKDRLGKTIQKIITIPAGLQRVNNPCPRIDHPAWLQRQLNDKATGKKQASITSMFAKVSLATSRLVTSGGNSTTAAGSSSGVKDGLGSTLGGMKSPQGKTGRGPLSQLGSPAATAPSTLEKKRHRALSFGEDEGQNTAPNAVPVPAVGDLEDIASPGPRGPGRPLAHFRKPTGQGQEPEQGDSPSQPPQAPVKPIGVDAPESDAQLQEWLIARKKNWKAHRLDRRRERRELSGGWTRESYMKSQQQGNDAADAAGGGDSSVPHLRKKPIGVADLVRGAALSATFGHWQVIELQETDAPGEFICWAMTNRTQLQRLKVVMPRVLYVNCMGRKTEESAQALGGARVKRDLPHARPLGALYEVSLSERKFQRNEKVLTEFLNDPQIEGVYESNTPLWLRGVLQLGCVARVSKSGGGPAGGAAGVGSRSYKLGELEFVNTVTHPYLTPATAHFRRVFVYVAEDKQRNSGLGAIGLFFVDGTNAEEEAARAQAARQGEDPLENSSARAFVWIVGGSGATQDSRPSLQRAYSKFQKDERAKVKFVTLVVPTMADCYRACSDKLGDYQRERHGPSIVVAQGSLAQRQWRRQIPALGEFPLAIIPHNSEDEKFPALQWQMFVGERMVQRFLIFPRWFADRLECSRFAHVPLCNLGSDALTTIIDVLLARQLQHNRHLLWAAEGPAPDIGGAEADQAAAWSDALSEEQINNTGAYRTVCVELDLYGLDVCAIMSSGVLDAEGITSLAVQSSSSGGGDTMGLGAGADGDGPGAASYTSATFSDSSCSRAFNLLKGLVASWIDNIRLRGDAISDSILTALYRYLCGFGDGLLYDPALHRVVYGLMTKLFRRLMGELRRLGAKVVYSDFRRVILDTGKHDLRAAAEYTQFLLTAIAERETFAAMEITHKCSWEQLLWLGPENCGGIKLTPESEEEQRRLALVGASGAEGEGNGEEEGEGEEGEGEEEEEGMDQAGAEPDEGGALSARRHKKIEDKGEGEGDSGDDYNEYSGDDEDYDDEDRSSKVRSKGGKGKGNRDMRFTPGHELDGLFSDDEDDAAADEATAAADAAAAASLEADEDPMLQANWNLASYLTPTAAIYFQQIVSSYLYQHRAIRQGLARRRDARIEELSVLQTMAGGGGDWAAGGGSAVNSPRPGSEAGGGDGSTAYSTLGSTYAGDEAADALLTEDGFNEAVGKKMKRWLQGKLLDHILSVVDLPEIVNGEFPQHAGSHLSLDSPSLELVKAVTHVLALDDELENEVKGLRRALLAHLRVREFDPVSNFRDPCLSYSLRDVICSYCSTCRDLDLLRDLRLTTIDLPYDAKKNRSAAEIKDLLRVWRWRCSHCENGLDTVEVENRLIQEVERLSTAYLLQDAYCTRTKVVNMRLCAATSDLAADLVMSTPPTSLQAQLRTLLRVARFHDFKLLAGTIEELL